MSESTTLLVRRLEYDDLPTRVHWMNMRSTFGQMPIRVPVSLSETRQWFSKTHLNEKRYDFVFVKEHGAESDLVCMAGLVDVDYQHQRAELYIMVNPLFTGQGIGTRALRWLCNFAFAHLALQRVYLFTVESNDRARLFYEKSGFVHEGILRRHAIHLGEFVDRHVHGILRSEWEAQLWRTDEVIFQA